LAIAYDPSVPLAHLMLASFETDEKRASFLRKFELDHLPHDTELWSQAAEILTQQKEPKLAIQAANEALELAPESADAQRVAGRAFAADSQFGAALKEFKTVMASSQAAAGDFLEAGYTAALAGNAAESARIFGRAEREFPKALGLFRYEGWAQIALKSPANAVDLFSHYQSLRGNEVPDEEASDAIRGLAVSRWLAGDQAGAVAEYQRLIASDPSWADAGNLDDVDFSEVASKPLHEVLDETLRQHPQLKPKPDAEAAQ
jgi:tetratricopeptide (TPR) repeat protein